MSDAVDRFVVTLGGESPMGSPECWAPICRSCDCDAFVTIVTPLFRARDVASAPPPLHVALDALRDLCRGAQLGDAPWFIGAVDHSVVRHEAGWPESAASSSGSVVVRLVSVFDVIDLKEIVESDFGNGALASAIFLPDPAAWARAPLGDVSNADGAVVRTQVRERRDAFVADCDVSVIRDRQVFRAKFTIPWVDRSTLRVLIESRECVTHQSDMSILAGPCAGRWALICRLPLR